MDSITAGSNLSEVCLAQCLHTHTHILTHIIDSYFLSGKSANPVKGVYFQCWTFFEGIESKGRDPRSNDCPQLAITIYQRSPSWSWLNWSGRLRPKLFQRLPKLIHTSTFQSHLFWRFGQCALWPQRLTETCILCTFRYWWWPKPGLTTRSLYRKE